MKTLKLLFQTIWLLVVPSAAWAAVGTPTEGGGLGEAAAKAQAAGKIAYGENIGTQSLEQIIGNLIQNILALLGVIFLILAVYGGYKWMMARGNEQEVEKAKETIKAAVIGAGIVLGAYAITSFVINKLIGATTGPTTP